MVTCKFIYKFKGKGASDTLNEYYEVQAVPRVGDKIHFGSNEASGPESKVLDVVHFINTESKVHEVIVYYGGSNQE